MAKRIKVIKMNVSDKGMWKTRCKGEREKERERKRERKRTDAMIYPNPFSNAEHKRQEEVK